MSEEYKCREGVSYKGRGPGRLRWNHNYGAFSEVYFGDRSVLLENPEIVSKSPTVGWAAAVWLLSQSDG